METFLTIASKRDTRTYAETRIPPDVVERILEAARVTGNAKNLQERRFVVLETVREQAASFVTRPGNLAGSVFAVAIVTGTGKFADFDAGRVAQSMMLAAWNDGVASCPNAIADDAAMADLLGAGAEERVAILVSFGYPTSRRDPERRTAPQWLAGADRSPVDDLVSVV
jgi:nitroreductase